MSLYLVYASSINNREVDSIFFFDVNNNCYIKHNDEVSPICVSKIAKIIYCSISN